MKKTLTGAVLCATLVAPSAFAGALSDPIVEEPIIVADTAGSSSGGTATVLLLALLFSLAYAD